MSIEFKKEVVPTSYLDASQGFKEVFQNLEIRTDPLTGRLASIMDFPMRKYSVPKPDLSDFVKRSLEMGCPFCPSNLEKVTPKFPSRILPEGRLNHGEISIFPNNASFAPYCAVAAMGTQHFVEIGKFSPDLLLHAFQACQLFIRKISNYDRRVKYCTINWNYFPPAGGSVIHPHLQPIADYYPVNHFRELLDASRRYQRRNRTVYWSDLIEKEQDLGERFIGKTGRVNWLVSFVPWSRWWDILAVFPGSRPVPDFSDQDWEDFVQGLNRILKFMSDQDYYSFNMTLFSTIDEKNYFWPHAHLTPRFPLPPLGTSDASYIELFLGQTTTAFPPEEVCQQIKQYF